MVISAFFLLKESVCIMLSYHSFLDNGARYMGDHYRPDWGFMSFLTEFLRPIPNKESSAWYHLLKRASGGCNDLLFSGHMLVAVLTAMAWTVGKSFLCFVFWRFLVVSYPIYDSSLLHNPSLPISRRSFNI